MRKIELLVPASSLEVLKIAVIFGADAVYIGGEAFGLRAKAKNFSHEDMKQGIAFAHEYGVKVYVTVNILAHNYDLEGVREYLKELKELKPDGLIIADPGIFTYVKETIPNMEIHISTQASTTNAASAAFWYKQGAKRVVTARELSFEEIKELRENTPADMDIETFVHGAMCMSYSGKCVISNHTTGRDANKGSCAQSCRWKYNLVEEKDGEYENVLDNEDYQFFFNTKDLCMIKYIPQIFDSGITSLKIEGRMKTAYYVATTVRAYRMAIDAYYKDPENWEFNPMWLDELKKGSHRDFSTGFFLDRPGKNSNNYESASYIRNYDFIGIVRDVLDDGYIIVEQRNKMSVNDDIEVIGPYKETMFTTILEMYNEDGEPIESAPHARQIVKMKLGIEVDKNYILRKPIIKG